MPGYWNTFESDAGQSVIGGNSRIQKFGPTGAFTTKWGALGTGDGQFNSPWGVAVDQLGYVYVTDIGNHRIEKFKPVQ